MAPSPEIETLKASAPAGLVLTAAQWESIRRGYSEPHRHYHTLEHLCAMARHFSLVSEELGWTHPREVYAALLFHDLVYDPARVDNEARSAERMRQILSSSEGSGVLDLDRVAQLVELTALHGQQLPSSLSADEALFLDIDMSILGTPEQVYLRYESQVEAEYLPVYPGPLFRMGRAEFLRKTLAAGPLFLSPLFHERFEGVAQRNMRTALVRLELPADSTH
jgi:predicted metal-dependent HD superfamily phosphohydrolase